MSSRARRKCRPTASSKITLSAEGEESVPAVKLTVQMPTGVTDVVAHPTQGLEAVRERPRSSRGRAGRSRTARTGKFAFTAHMPEHAGTSARLPGARHVPGREGRALDRRGVVRHARSARDAHGRPGQSQPPPPPPRRLPRRPRPPRATAAATPWIWIVIAAAIVGSPWRRSWSSGGAALEAVPARRRRPGGSAGSRCRGSLRHREARLPLDDHGRRPEDAGPQVQDPVRRRPGLARQPQRQDRDHQGLQRRAVPPLRPERDLRQHQLTRPAT